MSDRRPVAAAARIARLVHHAGADAAGSREAQVSLRARWLLPLVTALPASR